MGTGTSSLRVESKGSNLELALISYMALRKSLPFSLVREDNNANPKVNVRAGLDNGAANTTHTLKHVRSS